MLDQIKTRFGKGRSVATSSARPHGPRAVLERLETVACNPIPGGAHVGTVRSSGGVMLRYARWKPAISRQCGTLCLFSGRGEFIEKYYEVIADLRRRGFAVAILDWRGQGGSERLLRNPDKGHISNFAEYDDDVKNFMRDVVLPDCPAPYFALGHSMGGHILLRAARRPNCWFDRMVLAAPMLRFVELPASNRVVSSFSEISALLGFADSFVPGGGRRAMERLPFEGNRLTSDYDRYMRNKMMLDEMPHIGLGSPTIGWLYAAFQSINLINTVEFAESLTVPILVVNAGSDRIVSAPAIQQFTNSARMCKLIVVPGGRHELLQERDELREQFWAAFDTFIPGSTN